MKILQYTPEYKAGVKNLFFFTEGRLRPESMALFQPDDKGFLPKDVKAWVALHDGIVAGYGAICGNRSAVIVHPLYRRQGIGTEITKAMIFSTEECRVKVGATNVASIKMVLKAGLKLCNVGVYPDNKITWLEFGRNTDVKKRDELLSSGSSYRLQLLEEEVRKAQAHLFGRLNALKDGTPATEQLLETIKDVLARYLFLSAYISVNRHAPDWKELVDDLFSEEDRWPEGTDPDVLAFFEADKAVEAEYCAMRLAKKTM